MMVLVMLLLIGTASCRVLDDHHGWPFGWLTNFGPEFAVKFAAGQWRGLIRHRDYR